MNSHPVEEQVIVVTGAGKGIGRAFVYTLLSHPGLDRKKLKLCLASRTLSDLASLKTQAESIGVETEIVDADLSLKPTLAVERAVNRFKRLDALIHCAGVGRFGDFLSLTKEDLNDTVKTNVEATFLLLQHAYRVMKSSPKESGLRGQIQVITSVAAERPFPQSAIYCMTKYAQRGLLEVMRGYGYQDGIRILDIRAGAALTPMWGEVGAELESRMMKAEDVAKPMVEALFSSERTSMEVLTIRPLQGDV
ncbi:MAG: SDR family oxidoreductase [Bdellovibrionales bacterium]|nr:SDR family oxidoreductase [Bdellovibrionales bacterium]